MKVKELIALLNTKNMDATIIVDGELLGYTEPVVREVEIAVDVHVGTFESDFKGPHEVLLAKGVDKDEDERRAKYIKQGIPIQTAILLSNTKDDA